MALPVTPYVLGGEVVITSTLAYVRKAEHLKKDPRLALLASGVHMSGRAAVSADVAGDTFVSRLLAQEMRKYPPARTLARIPLHRLLFSWYFGRVLMRFEPEDVREVPGDDDWTLVTFGKSGIPEIAPIHAPEHEVGSFEPNPVAPTGRRATDGPAAVLAHLEPKPDMTDLRQLLLSGELDSGVFTVRSRSGGLGPAAPRSWLARIREQLEMHKRARRARKIMRRW
jgi:hypothetical protein